MPSRQEFRICRTKPALCTVICFAMIALAAVPRSFAQATSQTQTQTQTPPDAPSASKPQSTSTGIPGQDTFNLLQKKSLFFPNIATNTQRLSTGQKFQLFVNNSISLSAISWAALSSAVSQADNSPTGYEQG